MKTRILIVGTLLAILVAFAASGQPGAINATVVRHVNMLDSTKVLPINGSIYYNEQSHKFRAYQNNQWFDLINLGAGGGGISALGSLNGAAKTANGAAISGNTLYMQTADATFPGLVSTGSQTFAGNKSFNAHVYPASDNAIDLGSTSARWRTLYLADRLGIGVAPSTKFHVVGSDALLARVQGSSATRTELAIDNSEHSNRRLGLKVEATGAVIDATNFSGVNPGDLRLSVSASPKVTITNAGNVGIGTTSPNAPLQFAQTASNRKIVLRESANNDHEFFGFGHDGTGGLRYQVPATTASHAWFAGTGSTTSNELMRLTGGGILQFPSTSGKKIALHPGSGNDHEFYGLGVSGGLTYHTRNTGTHHIWYAGTSSSTSNELMKLEGTGRVTFTTSSVNSNLTLLQTGGNAIGIALNRTGATPTHWQIHLGAGTTDLKFFNTADRFVFSTSGIGTATNWVATSDIRLKNNIKYVGSQLDKVTSIANVVRNYDRIDNGENETGFVAQELYEVAPEYVVKGNDSTMWAVNYQKMVVPLYKAVAELQEQINELREENALLRKQALDRAGREAHRNRFTESFQEADGEFTRKMKALKKARR